MSTPDHECDFEEICDGVVVALGLGAFLRACPQYERRTLSRLLEQHAEAIAAHMTSAGIAAAVQLFSNPGEMS